MQFVIWGAGERGRRLYKQLTDKYIVAFIDENLEVEVDNLPIISLDEYKANWCKYPIIISFEDEKAGVDILNNKGVNSFFKLTDACGPYQEPYQREYLKKYIKNYFKHSKKYLIRGRSIHAIMVAQWGRESGADVYIDEDGFESRFVVKQLKKEGFCLVRENDIEYDEILNCDYATDTNNYKGDVKEFFDLDRRIADYDSKSVKKFQNKHNGEKCFIVATGPSLRIEDLNVLKENNIDTFSMNEIYKAYTNTCWRPDYFVAEDYVFLSSYRKNKELNKDDETVFLIGDTNEDVCKNNKKNEYIYHVNYIRRDYDKTRFATDLTKGTYAGGTVTYECLQWAIYMGYNEIYLLGVDFSYYGEEKKNYAHFFEEKVLTARPATEWVYNSYVSAKDYASQNNVKIYNATRGGKLEVFERVDFDSLFV